MAQFSTQENSISIDCEKYHYNPGEQVRGKVLLNIVSALEVQDIKLKFTGTEQTEWLTLTYRKEADGSQTLERDGPHSGRHDFFKTMLPMGQNMALTHGQFEFPFSVQLPNVLPGSCEVGTNPKFLQDRVNHSRCWAMCRYKIKAVIQAKNLGAYGNKDMKCTQVFQIVNLPPPTDERVVSQTQDVFRCCRNLGSVSMQLQAEKDAFKKGDPIRVVAKFQNQSKASINSVHLKLTRVIELKSHTGRVFQEIIPLTTSQEQGCAAMTNKEARMAVTVPTDSAKSTCIGSIMKVHYLLRVRGKVTVAKTLKIEIPVAIFELAPKYVKPVSTNWEPRVMPMFTVETLPGYNPGNVPNWSSTTTTTTTTSTTTNHAAPPQNPHHGQHNHLPYPPADNHNLPYPPADSHNHNLPYPPADNNLPYPPADSHSLPYPPQQPSYSNPIGGGGFVAPKPAYSSPIGGGGFVPPQQPAYSSPIGGGGFVAPHPQAQYQQPSNHQRY